MLQALKPIAVEAASLKLCIGEDAEDVLNDVRAFSCHKKASFRLMPISQLRLSENKKSIAFCTDSGTVGVIDVATNDVSRMRTKHNSV